VDPRPQDYEYEMLNYFREKFLKTLEQQISPVEKQLAIQKLILEYHQILPNYPVSPNLLVINSY
jgi:hypothetical protein